MSVRGQYMFKRLAPSYIGLVIVFILVTIAGFENIDWTTSFILYVWSIVIGLGGATWIVIDKILH